MQPGYYEAKGWFKEEVRSLALGLIPSCRQTSNYHNCRGGSRTAPTEVRSESQNYLYDGNLVLDLKLSGYIVPGAIRKRREVNSKTKAAAVLEGLL